MREVRRALVGLVVAGALLPGPSLAARAEPEPDPYARDPAPQGVRERERADPAKDGVARPVLERIWGYRRLYDDPDGPVLRRVDVRGRFQADYALLEADRGSYSEVQVRRFRIGFESHWAADLRLHVEADLDLSCEKAEDCDDDPYEGLTDAYLAWRPSPAFELKVGKHSAPFTLDGTTSSTRLLTPERNNLSNNLWFPEEYHAGVAASGKLAPWGYRVGVFSSSTTEEFGSFDGGYFGLVSVSYEVPRCPRSVECWLKLDYVYNHPDEGNVSTRDLEHVASLQLHYDSPRVGLRADLSGGIGYLGQPDLVGLALMPFVHLGETVMLVGRYTWLHSFGDDGIRFNRYDSRIEAGRGDRYHELFVGLNWLLYGDRFKVQTGLTWTRMRDRPADGGDYEGWGWTTGVRMSW